MGNLTERSSKFVLDFRYLGVRCREKTGLKNTKRNKKKLLEQLDKIEEEIHLNTFLYEKHFPNGSQIDKFKTLENVNNMASAQSTVLFENFSITWQNKKHNDWRASHQEKIATIFNLYLLPQFGHCSIDFIMRKEIIEFRNSLLKIKPSLSPSRVNQIMSPLRLILNDAAEQFNFECVWQDIKPQKLIYNKINPFSLKETMAIINCVRHDFKNYYTVRFFTGLRTGEIDGLKWCDIDLVRKRLKIRRALVNGILGPTKTSASNRFIDVSKIVVDALTDQQKHQKVQSEFVFCNQVGLPLAHRNVTKRVWYPLLDSLNIEKRPPLQTRHTTASLWISSGESLEWVTAQMGFKNKHLLHAVYGDYMPNEIKKGGSAFDRFLDDSSHLYNQ